MHTRFAFIVLWSFIVPAQLPAEDPARGDRQTVPDDINDRFLDPDLDTALWTERWEAESREIFAHRNEIVRNLQLTSGMYVADVGSGTGLFVESFAEAVTEKGKVYALDISPKFVEHIRQRAKKTGLEHVEVLLSKSDSTELPPASVDAVFLCDTYHHFEHPQKMLHSIHRALRPGGRLAVVDFERIEGKSREWILGHVRAGKQQVRKEIEDAGFVLDQEVRIEGLKENYFLRFKKSSPDDRP